MTRYRTSSCRRVRLHRAVLSVVAACLLAPAAVRAQEPGAYAVFVPAITFQDSNSALGLTGAFGVRLNRAAAFELELTGIPDLVDAPDLSFLGRQLGLPGATLLYPAPSVDMDARAIAFLVNTRIFIPTTIARVQPFFVAGGGLGHLRQELSFSVPSNPLFTGVTSVPGLTGVPVPSRGVTTTVIGRPGLPIGPITVGPVTETALVLNLGGGARVDVWKRLFVDADLRYYRVLGSRDRNIGRFGAGVGYRF